MMRKHLTILMLTVCMMLSLLTACADYKDSSVLLSKAESIRTVNDNELHEMDWRRKDVEEKSKHSGQGMPTEGIHKFLYESLNRTRGLR